MLPFHNPIRGRVVPQLRKDMGLAA